MDRHIKWSIVNVIQITVIFIYYANGQNNKMTSNWPPKAPEFFDLDKDNIVGVGGKDYPIYASIPKTSFKCDGQLPGFYADQETQCQVFHLCANNHKTSFLCGNGTVFNQRLFTCNWWYNTTCNDSHKYYSLNSELYKAKNKTNEGISGHLLPLKEDKAITADNNKRFNVNNFPRLQSGPQITSNNNIRQPIPIPIPRHENQNIDSIVRHVMEKDSEVEEMSEEEQDFDSNQGNEDSFDENKPIYY